MENSYTKFEDMEAEERAFCYKNFAHVLEHFSETCQHCFFSLKEENRGFAGGFSLRGVSHSKGDLEKKLEVEFYKEYLPASEVLEDKKFCSCRYQKELVLKDGKCDLFGYRASELSKAHSYLKSLEKLEDKKRLEAVEKQNNVKQLSLF